MENSPHYRRAVKSVTGTETNSAARAVSAVRREVELPELM
jgi:hypothetical protein